MSTTSVALVTAGTRGIGRACVEALLADGWNVAFTFRTDEDGARSLAAGSGGRARAFALDVRHKESPGPLVAEIEAAMGPINGLVNNAGVRRESLLAFTPDHDWDEVLDVNLAGAFRCCRAVLPGMMHRRQGSIVNISSLSAVCGLAGQTAYAASKSAMLGLTRALAREAGRRNVRSNAVLPGFVPTDMTAALPAEVVSALRGHECLARGTSPADVANLVAFLMSDRAAAITGQAVIIDSGSSA